MTRRPRRQWRFRLRLIELALLTASGHTKAENGRIYETQKKTARMKNTAELKKRFFIERIKARIHLQSSKLNSITYHNGNEEAIISIIN